MCPEFPCECCRWLDVARADRCHASGGQMAVPSLPAVGLEALQLTGHGHGGLLFLLLDQ